MIALILALLVAAPQDTFPRDSVGHRYVESEQFGADSAAAAQMVEIWKTRDENGTTFACLYGAPAMNDSGQVVARVTRVEREGMIDPNSDEALTRCHTDAIGFLAFGSGMFNAGGAVRAITGIITKQIDWVLGAVVYGVTPVPAADVAKMHIPPWVPQVLAVLYMRSAPHGSTPI